jgi:hypothetical protein
MRNDLVGIIIVVYMARKMTIIAQSVVVLTSSGSRSCRMLLCDWTDSLAALFSSAVTSSANRTTYQIDTEKHTADILTPRSLAQRTKSSCLLLHLFYPANDAMHVKYVRASAEYYHEHNGEKFVSHVVLE